MLALILNDTKVVTDLPTGVTVLDFLRRDRTLKGTKIGCREGDCGACTVLVGELADDGVRYRAMTSCLMPLANAAGKHIVTVEGLNPPNGALTLVQEALVGASATQCGFCTTGIVMALTAYCLTPSDGSAAAAVAAVDGNICRCTGYKSIERAAARVASTFEGSPSVSAAVARHSVPDYFPDIRSRLLALAEDRETSSAVSASTMSPTAAAVREGLPRVIAGGTDLYVQRPEEMIDGIAQHLADRDDLRFVRRTGSTLEIGAATVVTDLLESAEFLRLFPKAPEELALVSSTPIRNMATIGGNLVNASPIGDMSIWFLALDAQVSLVRPDGRARTLPLRDMFRSYRQLAKDADEIVSAISFNADFTHFHFEKVSRRTHLDIASVNSAIALRVVEGTIIDATVSAGGVSPIPLVLQHTSEYLRGKPFAEKVFVEAGAVARSEIHPISDVRGSADYKALLLERLLLAHYFELQGVSC